MSWWNLPNRRRLGVDYVRVKRNRAREFVLVGCPTIHRIGRHGEKASRATRLDDFGWSILLHFAPEKAEAWRGVDGHEWLPPMMWAGATVTKAHLLSAVARREEADRRQAASELEFRRLNEEQTRVANERKERGEFIDSPFRLARRSWPLHPALRPARWATALRPGRLFEELSTLGELVGIPIVLMVWAYRYAPTTTSLIAAIYVAAFFLFVWFPRFAARRILRARGYKGLLGDEFLAVGHYSWSLAIASGRWWSPMAPLRLLPTRELLGTTPMFRAHDPYGTLRRAMIVRWRSRNGARRAKRAEIASAAA